MSRVSNYPNSFLWNCISSGYKVFESIVKPFFQFWFYQHLADWARAAPKCLQPEKAHVMYPNILSKPVLERFSVPREVQEQVNLLFGLMPIEDLFNAKQDSITSQNGFQIISRTALHNLVLVHNQFPFHVLKLHLKQDYPNAPIINNLSRVSVSSAMRSLIEKMKLFHLYIPLKNVAHIPGRSFEPSDENYLVFAEKLDLMSEEESAQYFNSLSLQKQTEIIKQLYSLLLESGYHDSHKANFRFIKSGEHYGQLALFDTESQGVIEPHLEMDESLQVLGYLRFRDIALGLLGIDRTHNSKLIALPWPKEIMQDLANEYGTEAKKELQSIRAKRLFWQAVPTATVMTAIVAQFILQTVNE